MTITGKLANVDLGDLRRLPNRDRGQQFKASKPVDEIEALPRNASERSCGMKLRDPYWLRLGPPGQLNWLVATDDQTEQVKFMHKYTQILIDSPHRP